MPASTAPADILVVRNVLGEGIIWEARHGALWWTDIQSRCMLRYDWSLEATRRLVTPQRVGSFGLVRGSDSLITAFESGLALYGPFDQSIAWLARPTELVAGVRFNDGHVDRRGRFWSGTMVESAGQAAEGRLYCVGPKGEVRSRLGGIRISNGSCVSPDGRILYFADSPTRTIKVFELDEPTGHLGASRVFAQTPDGAFPDGAAVDVDGCLWSAHWGAGCIVRYTPTGKVDRTLRVPVTQPTCVCFGGPELDVLCVTTAREGLTDSELLSQPNAGDVLMYRVGVQGLAEGLFRL